jgi:hypothetical protein
MVQPFPATALAWTALGYPAPIVALRCDEAASPLANQIDANTLAQFGVPLYSHIMQGPAVGTNLWTKAAVETYGAVGWAAAAAATWAVGSLDFTIAIGFRARSKSTGAARYLAAHYKETAAVIGWILDANAATGNLELVLSDSTGSTTFPSGIKVTDDSFHWATISVDRDVGVAFDIDANARVSVAGTRPNTLTQALRALCLGNLSSAVGYNEYEQFAIFFLALAVTPRSAHDAAYRHLLAAGLGFPNTYTRATPMVTPISATQTACAAAGQVSVGYTAGAVSAARGNALGTGLTCENATAFLSLNTVNMPGWGASGPASTVVDGASGMRDAIQCADIDGLTRYWYSSQAVVATTATPYTFGISCKTGGVGTRAQGVAYFTGSAAGPEWLVFVDINPVPAEWTAYSGTVTPVNNDHNRVVLLCVPTDGVGASIGTHRFCNGWGYRGDKAVVAFKYTGNTGAAETMNCPVELIDNTAGQRFSPAEGTIEIELSGFAGAYSVGVPADLFHAVPAAGDAGRLYWRMLSVGTVEIRAYDDAGAAAWTMSTAAVPDDAYHKYRLRWKAGAPIYSTGGNDYHAILEEITAVNPEGLVLDYAGAANYAVPAATTVPNVYVGSYAGVNAARCSVALVKALQWARNK